MLLTCRLEVDCRTLFAGFGRTFTTEFMGRLLFEVTSSSAAELVQVFRSTSDNSSSALMSELLLISNLFFRPFEGFSWVDGVDFVIPLTREPSSVGAYNTLISDYIYQNILKRASNIPFWLSDFLLVPPVLFCIMQQPLLEGHNSDDNCSFTGISHN